MNRRTNKIDHAVCWCECYSMAFVINEIYAASQRSAMVKYAIRKIKTRIAAHKEWGVTSAKKKKGEQDEYDLALHDAHAEHQRSRIFSARSRFTACEFAAIRGEAHQRPCAENPENLPIEPLQRSRNATTNWHPGELKMKTTKRTFIS